MIYSSTINKNNNIHNILNSNLRVSVHFNFHKKLFSDIPLEGKDKNRVMFYSDDLSLTNCTYKVRSSGISFYLEIDS